MSFVEAVEAEVDSLREPQAPHGEVVVEGAPPPWRHFRGRNDEIARGLAHVRRSRLVSVTGLPGMGKTEVSLEIARQAVRDPSLRLERAVWLALDEVVDADALRVRLALAFGLDPKACPDGAALARHVGALRALVLLDNAEDLIAADRAGLQGLVEALLHGGPSLRLLLSTRRRLGDLRDQDELELLVNRLPAAEAEEAFLSAAGARLAPEARGSGELGDLLEWLDGHPLSLMLIARLAGSAPLATLLSRLRANEVELVVDEAFLDDDLNATLDKKLRTKRLVSSMNLSFLPLRERHPEAAEMLVWLSCFPAGLPAVLVPQVFGPDAEARKALLLRAYLVEEQGPERRLGLPAPLRAFAARQASALAPERRLELVASSFEAHAGWLRVLHGRLGQPGAREAIERAARDEASLATLLRTLDNVPLPPPGSDRATELAAAMGDAFAPFARLMTFSGRARITIDLGEHLRRAVESMSGAAPLAATEKALGDLYVRTDRLKEAEEAYHRALPIYSSIEDRLGEANTLSGLGNLLVAHGDPLTAFARYLEALALHQRVDNQLGVAAAHCYLARAAMAAARPLRAAVLGRWALKIFEGMEDEFDQMLTLRDLSQALYRLDREEPASAALVLAWSHAAAIKDPFAAHMAQQTGHEAPPDADDVQIARALLTAALSACEAELQASGEDPYAPLTPP